MSPHTIVSGIFNIPSPQKKSQKKNSTIRSIPKSAKPTVPSSVSRVSIPENSAKIRKLSANLENFPQTPLCSLECSYFFAGPTCVRRTEAYPILKTFLRFFKLRRFGGVGAPEGLENVPDILTQNFPQNKCFCLFIMALQNQNFPQDFPHTLPKDSAKNSKSG